MPKNLNALEIRILKRDKGKWNSFYGMFVSEVKFPEKAYRKNISEYYTSRELATFFPHGMIKIVNNERKYKKRIDRRYKKLSEGSVNRADFKPIF